MDPNSVGYNIVLIVTFIILIFMLIYSDYKNQKKSAKAYARKHLKNFFKSLGFADVKDIIIFLIMILWIFILWWFIIPPFTSLLLKGVTTYTYNVYDISQIFLPTIIQINTTLIGLVFIAMSIGTIRKVTWVSILFYANTIIMLFLVWVSITMIIDMRYISLEDIMNLFAWETFVFLHLFLIVIGHYSNVYRSKTKLKN